MIKIKNLRIKSLRDNKKVYAFFTTTGMIASSAPTNQSTYRYNQTYYAVQNASGIGSQVFNVIGVVLVIGAIMLIVTIVYSYMRP